MRFVDLSVPITQSPAETPEPLRTEIDFSDHAEGARQIETLLGVPPHLLRDGEGVGGRDAHPSRHAQLDPRRCAVALQLAHRGERAQTIDELPLDWFFGPGVVVEMTAKADGEAIEIADLEGELERIGHELAAAESGDPGPEVPSHPGVAREH